MLLPQFVFISCAVLCAANCCSFHSFIFADSAFHDNFLPGSACSSYNLNTFITNIKLEVASPPGILCHSRYNTISPLFMSSVHLENGFFKSQHLKLSPFPRQWSLTEGSLSLSDVIDVAYCVVDDLTPLTVMQRTYLSCHLAFTAFPVETPLLPGPLFGVSVWAGFMFI